MTGHAKQRILLGAGLMLAALCVVVALRVVRATKKPPTPAEQATYVAPQVEIEPAVAATHPHRVRAATSNEHLRHQSDTEKQQKTIKVERVVTGEDFKRLPVTHLLDHHPGGEVYNTWGVLSRRDLDQAGSLERALGRTPGIVFRQTDPP